MVITGQMNLVLNNTQAWTSINADQNLFIQGSNYPPTSYDNSLNLSLNGTVAHNNMPLYTLGDYISKSYAANILPLLVDGHMAVNSSVTLMIENLTTQWTNNVKLFIKAPTPITQTLPLVMDGLVQQSLNKNTTLFTWSGDSVCELLNLTLKCNSIPAVPFNIPLMVNGSNQAGNFSVIPLNVIGQPPYKFLNLSINGKDSGGNSAVLKLFIKGGNAQKVANTTLFLENDYQSIGLDTYLFVKGDGIYPGAFPAFKPLNLFIQRGPEAGITLFMCNYGVEGNTPLYINGFDLFTSSIAIPPIITEGYKYSVPAVVRRGYVQVTPKILTLYINGYGDAINNNTDLFINGQIFQTVTSNSTLVMPEIVGFTPEFATLYTHGFNY